ncbi:MAG: nicotinate-nucleotide--dimethylbenzimidazole phosphoribosyltransferase [Synergistaceae bacterium]|nr:nicotinate-nucleotide--dimethylbenzimidazole phosphoribosyltransferase [Synergistaceae bacterium]
MIHELLKQITPLNTQAMKAAQELQNKLIKPSGSLGELERISVRIAGITGKAKNTLTRKIICLFGSDHGIYNEGVCSSPQEFTRKLMEVYAENQNGGINILSRQAGAELRLYDLGVKGLSEHENIITKKFMPNGTNNFLHGRSMSRELAEEVIMYGISIVRDAKREGISIIGTGEAGMSNTTPACACIMAALNTRDASLVGRGAGLNDSMYEHKKHVILEALNFHSHNLTDPVNIISCVGGLDIAAMTGIFTGGAIYHVPVIIDGVISIAAALLAYQLEPLTREYMFASHESLEPSYNYASKFMGLMPPLHLDMRLGEGTGCTVFMHIIDDALAVINDMGTFDELQEGEK